MKITIISDTHSQHAELGTLSGDVLIHCGDMFNLCDRGDDHAHRLDEWFGEQDFDLILCTGGNHDFVLEDLLSRTHEPFDNAVYLEDRRYEFDGVVFYGAPWTPMLSTHAFYQSEEELRDTWWRVPHDTDVLITHTPPFGILDVSSRDMVLGCKHLAAAAARVRPAIHCFGHVHHSAGSTRHHGTIFVNACSVNSAMTIARDPIVMEI